MRRKQQPVSSYLSSPLSGPSGSGNSRRRGRKSNGYVSRRSVPPIHTSSSSGVCSTVVEPCLCLGADAENAPWKWTMIKCALLCSGLIMMLSAAWGISLIEIMSSAASHTNADNGNGDTAERVHGLHAVANANSRSRTFLSDNRGADTSHGANVASVSDTSTKNTKDMKLLVASSPLARGIAGLPMDQTPALVGARRGHIDCDVDVDDLAYWNDPQGTRDMDFVSPFASSSTDGEGNTAKLRGGGTTETEQKQQQRPVQYLTFQPDSGGWNNVRMSLEIIFILALALDRTLVLPPPMPLYLLNRDKGSRHRTFGDFYPLHGPSFQKKLDIITMEEFIEKEGGADGRFPLPAGNRTSILKAVKGCDHRKKSQAFCGTLDVYLQSIGVEPPYHTHPDFTPPKPKSGKEGCFIFDEMTFQTGKPSEKVHAQALEFCGTERRPYYFDSQIQQNPIIHFKASERWHRLCQHFYGAVLFTDPAIDNYYKRFVRDYMRYQDVIYCAAGKIVHAIQRDGKDRGFDRDAQTGTGGYSALHIRRGDLQFKKVKISAQAWYDNTKEIWKEKEILYIATDERNKTWFDPLRRHHDLKFLDDYWEMAGLENLDPNYMGMIDTVVAARGRAFAGTFFSTFSGYINRMRGYHGLSMKDSYYSFLDKKYEMHEWHDQPKGIWSHEWPAGWMGIDGDEPPNPEIF